MYINYGCPDFGVAIIYIKINNLYNIRLIYKYYVFLYKYIDNIIL